MVIALCAAGCASGSGGYGAPAGSHGTAGAVSTAATGRSSAAPPAAGLPHVTAVPTGRPAAPASPAGFAAPTKRTNCVERNGLPDTACTPGATNPAVTQTTIVSTICTSGWTTTVRPPTSVTGPIKLERIAAYRLPGPPARYELDHLIPLELGGATASIANLWPEPYADTEGARRKDEVENALHRAVCAGTMLLAHAQQLIAHDWEHEQQGAAGSAAAPSVTIPPPPAAASGGAPPGATAVCNDGSSSHSQHRRGTCSGHGGVRTWLVDLPA